MYVIDGGGGSRSRTCVERSCELRTNIYFGRV